MFLAVDDYIRFRHLEKVGLAFLGCCVYTKAGRILRQEAKSVTAFDLFTFFRADLIQSEASWKLSSTSDWLMSA